MGFGAGQGVKCYHSEHLYGELWHRAFIVAPRHPRAAATSSVAATTRRPRRGSPGCGARRTPRARGLKRVQVEPHLSVTGAVSAEWVPIRPKTDAAFLYALLHRIVHERDWRGVCDVAFLEDSTNAPYLVGPPRLLPPRPGEPQAPAVGRRGGPRGPARRDRRAAPGPRRGPGRGRRGGGAGRARSGGTRRRRLAPRSRPSWTTSVITPRSGRRGRATSRPRRPAASRTSSLPTPASARPSRSRAASFPTAPSRCSSARG